MTDTSSTNSLSLLVKLIDYVVENLITGATSGNAVAGILLVIFAVLVAIAISMISAVVGER